MRDTLAQFRTILAAIRSIFGAGVNWADASYEMIVQNPLLIGFVIMVAIIVGVSVIRKLLNS